MCDLAGPAALEGQGARSQTGYEGGRAQPRGTQAGKAQRCAGVSREPGASDELLMRRQVLRWHQEGNLQNEVRSSGGKQREVQGIARQDRGGKAGLRASQEHWAHVEEVHGQAQTQLHHSSPWSQSPAPPAQLRQGLNAQGWGGPVGRCVGASSRKSWSKQLKSISTLMALTLLNMLSDSAVSLGFDVFWVTALIFHWWYKTTSLAREFLKVQWIL